MDLLKPVRAFDGVQPRHRWLAIPVAVLKKFSDDRAGSLAALIAYYAFFSLFPLLLVFVTVLGYVLHGDPSAQRGVESSVLGSFPIIGKDLRDRSLHGHGVAIVVGLLASLWAGLGVTRAAQNAFDQVWAVPFKDRPNPFVSRLRGLGLLVALGTIFLVSSGVSGAVAGGLGGAPLQAAGLVLSLLLNLVLYGVTFRLLTSSAVPTRSLWIGVALGAVAWELLQGLGGYYVAHVVDRANDTYGFFALAIGVLVWLHLGAQATLYALETNVVIARRLWPRSLIGDGRDKDEVARRALAEIEERSDAEQVQVRFRR